MIEIAGATITHLLGAYGYWAVLLFIAVESAGIPFPGESMLLAAAVYAGKTHQLEIGGVVVAAAAGAILGDNLGYLAGREGGYRLLNRFGRYLRMDERKLRLGQYLFATHGGRVVFFGRFVAVLRCWAAFLAGTYRMRWTQFLTYNAAGGVAWAAVMGMLGYLFGSRALALGGPIGALSIALATVAAIVGLIALRRNEARLQAEADRALAAAPNPRPVGAGRAEPPAARSTYPYSRGFSRPV